MFILYRRFNYITVNFPSFLLNILEVVKIRFYVDEKNISFATFIFYCRSVLLVRLRGSLLSVSRKRCKKPAWTIDHALYSYILKSWALNWRRQLVKTLLCKKKLNLKNNNSIKKCKLAKRPWLLTRGGSYLSFLLEHQTFVIRSCLRT